MTDKKFSEDIADTAAIVKDRVAKAAETASAMGKDAVASGRDALSDAASALRDDVADRAEDVKESLADGGERLARTLRNSAADHDENSVHGRVLDAVAGGVSHASESLRGQSFGGLISEAKGFARRNPGVFVLGAALAGFALARFGRADDSDRSGA